MNSLESSDITSVESDMIFKNYDAQHQHMEEVHQLHLNE
jgi:hypothetical protein